MEQVERPIERGDVFRASLPGPGHQTRGPHYAVVVSDEPYNWLSTLVIVPLSSSAQPSATHPELHFRGARTRALVEQVTALDKRHLREKVDNLSGTGAMEIIDEQLRYLLALDY
ncbi:MAG: type II toxin-antitoxin system PemK/MazF family toxin [Bacteroidetes bacterium]|nr:type II toxin-antitoxin system PemK/MazF family toxin [Bacteroidota bacterium]